MTTNPETAGVDPVAIKPCPFCACPFPAICTPVYGNQRISVKCPSCHSHGGYGNDEAESIAAWNERAHLPAAREDGEALLRAALRRAVSDMQQTPETNRGGAIVLHVQESTERIRQALATTRPEQAPETTRITLNITKDEAHEMTRVVRWERATAASLEAEEALEHANCAVGEEVVERISKVIFEADPAVGTTWEEWVAYAEAHPHHLQAVEFVRNQARAVAAMPTPAAIRAETTAQERERCAKVVEDHGEAWGLQYRSMTDALANAIRRDHLTGGGV